MRIYKVYSDDIGSNPVCLDKLPNNELHAIVNGVYGELPLMPNSEPNEWSDFIAQCKIILLARSMGLL